MSPDSSKVSQTAATWETVKLSVGNAWDMNMAWDWYAANVFGDGALGPPVGELLLLLLWPLLLLLGELLWFWTEAAVNAANAAAVPSDPIIPRCDASAIGLQFCNAAEMWGGNEEANEGGMADAVDEGAVDTFGDVRLLWLFDTGGDRDDVEWDDEEDTRLVLELDISSAAVIVCDGDGCCVEIGAPLAIMVLEMW